MYTTPQIASPSGSTKTANLYSLPLTISPVPSTEICSGNTISSFISSGSSNNQHNNNNNNSKVIEASNIEPMCLTKAHEYCNRSVYEYINSREKFEHISDKVNRQPFKISDPIFHDPIKIQQKFEYGKTRHDIG